IATARGVPLIRAHVRIPRIASSAFGTPGGGMTAAPHGGLLARPRGALAAPRGALLAAPALLVAAVLVWPSAEPEVRVRALDVGQGDAYLVELGGATLLVDGGPDPA